VTAIHENSGVKIVQITQWSAEAMDYIEEVAAGNLRREIVTAFWIRSYGVLHDIRRQVQVLCETLTTTDPRLLDQLGLGTVDVKLFNEVIASIDNMRAAFDEDELSYFEYRRHVECHPLQHAYTLKVQNGAIKTRFSKFTGREWTYEEEDAAQRRVIRRHSSPPGIPNEPAIALDFAQRLRPLRVPYQNAVEALFGKAVWIPPVA
jgi:hypothetical protein